MQIVIAFHEWGVGACYDREEKGRGSYVFRENAFRKYTMSEDCIEDSDLFPILAFS